MGGDILDWGDPSPVTLPVEFEIYETIDLNELLAMTTMSFGTQPMLKLMEHFNMTVFPETGITVRDPGKLGYELDQEKIRLTGIATGNTSITFRAFAFDVSGAWWNLFGVEVPEQVVKLQEVSVSTPPANTPTPVPVPTNFVYIPAGTFQMGAPEDEDCRQNDEVPRHSVTLTKDLYVQQAEMTRQQWAYVFGPVPPESEKNLPTCYISFYDACIYCNRISVADGFRPCYYEDESYVVMFDGTPPVYRGPVFWDQSADGYRLPTEAEWEYACRAGTLTPYNNGDENTSCAQEDPNLNPLAWYRYNSDVGRETEAHDVGLKQPNAWQLYDMHGNVFEWCWDWYETFYYESSPSVNPSGPLSGEYHVIRGGDFYSAPADCRSAGRYYQVPNAFCNDLGFRLFRSD